MSLPIQMTPEVSDGTGINMTSFASIEIISMTNTWLLLVIWITDESVSFFMSKSAINLFLYLLLRCFQMCLILMCVTRICCMHAIIFFSSLESFMNEFCLPVISLPIIWSLEGLSHIRLGPRRIEVTSI